MAGCSSHQVIPSPNFGVAIEESALAAKANLWTQVLEQQRPQFYGSQKRHLDFYDAEGQGGDRYGSKKRQQQRGQASFSYYCDACDRAFKSDDQFKVHTSQHEKCVAKDCKYMAAPKLVKLHYDMQHKTGLAAKIRESSEDIQKWIEERKRNFPTAANIQRKAEELRERQERGEVLETKQFGKMRGRGRGRGNRRRGGYSRGGQQNYSYSHHRQDNSTGQTLKREYETTDPLSKLACSVTDRPDHATQNTPHMLSALSPSPTTASTAPTGLSCLLSNYADMGSDEEEEKLPPQPAAEAKRAEQVTVSTNSIDSTHDGLNHHTAHSGSVKPTTDKSRHKQQKGKSSMRGQQRQNGINMKTTKSTLLEKLLASEIRRERNVLLQCVRHVVQQDFFGVGKKSNLVPASDYKDDDVWE